MLFGDESVDGIRPPGAMKSTQQNFLNNMKPGSKSVWSTDIGALKWMAASCAAIERGRPIIRKGFDGGEPANTRHAIRRSYRIGDG
jgi:hypothetical protein